MLVKIILLNRCEPEIWIHCMHPVFFHSKQFGLEIIYKKLYTIWEQIKLLQKILFACQQFSSTATHFQVCKESFSNAKKKKWNDNSIDGGYILKLACGIVRFN